MRHPVLLSALALLLWQPWPSGLARAETATANPSIHNIDFGVPQFIHSPSARRVLDEVILRETQLLELARWLSLEEAIKTALANNPELAAAYSTIEEDRWTVIAARRSWSPTLSIQPNRDSTLQLGGAVRESTTSQFTPPGTTTSSTSSEENQSLNTAVNLNWTFFDRSRGPTINAAVSELKAQRYLFDVAARNLVLDVQAAYFQLQAQMRLVDQYKLITLMTSLQLDQAIDMQRSRRIESNQIEQLRTTQRASITRLIEAYVALFEVSVELSRLLGLPGLDLVLASDSSLSDARWSDDVQTSVAHSEAFREEIQASLQQSQAQRWRSSALLGAYWPKLSLLGVGNLDGFNARSSGVAGLTSTESGTTRMGTVGVALNWDLFDGGIKAADAASRRLASETLALQAESIRLQVSAQVRKAYTRYDGALLQVENTQDAVNDSWSAFLGAIRLFEANAVNATTLIQTQSQLVDALTAAASAQRLQNTALAELYRFSARWPSTVQRLFEQRLDQFQREGARP